MVTLFPTVTEGSENVTVQDAAHEIGVVKARIMAKATLKAANFRKKNFFIELLPIYCVMGVVPKISLRTLMRSVLLTCPSLFTSPATK